VTNLAALTPKPSGVHLPKTLGDRDHELGTEIGPGLGEHQVSGTQTAVRNPSALRSLPTCLCCGRVITRLSRETLEYFSAAACAAVTGHDEPSRASGESEDGEEPIKLPKTLCYGYKVSILSLSADFGLADLQLETLFSDQKPHIREPSPPV